MAAMGQLLGAALAGAGVACVAMQFMKEPTAAAVEAEPADELHQHPEIAILLVESRHALEGDGRCISWS